MLWVSILDSGIQFLLPVVIVVFSLIAETSSDGSYIDITSEVFKPHPPRGTPAAFWDTNNDRMTDVLMWNNESMIHVFESISGLQQKHPVLEISRAINVHVDPSYGKIDAVIPGDFDGDLHLDVVVVVCNDVRPPVYRLLVARGHYNHTHSWGLLDPKPLTVSGVELELERQPTVIDYDGNTVPDFLVQRGNDIEVLQVDLKKTEKSDSTKSSFTWITIPWQDLTDLGKISYPHSNAFIDINGDLIADVIVTMKNNAEEFMLVVSEHDDFQKHEKVHDHPYREPVQIRINSSVIGWPDFIIGQIAFVDLNDDLRIDAVFPVQKADGSETKIISFDWQEATFHTVKTDWNGQLLRQPDDEFPLRIHMGDFDQDGYIDGVAVTESKKVILLRNSPVSDADQSRRYFKVHTEYTKSLSEVGVVFAAFFDAYDDGFLDILTVVETIQGEREMRAYKNQLGIDATWIKAMVYTGFCGQSLPGMRRCGDEFNERALSLPVAGATIFMETTRGDGGHEKVAAGLLSQFTHFSLQMPTTIFGLGRSPNFVDNITVGLAPVVNLTTDDRHSKIFEQTIPNSAVVISPHPLNEPSKWRAFIYVTPSSAMLETGIVLSVVFALLAILVGLLHFKERREDQKEKLVEMQRFHFDAM